MITTIKLRDVRNGEIDFTNVDSIHLLDARDRIALEMLKIIVAKGRSDIDGLVDVAFKLSDSFIAKANEQEKEND